MDSDNQNYIGSEKFLDSQSNTRTKYIYKCKLPDCKNIIKMERRHIERHAGFCPACHKKGKPHQSSYSELLKTARKTKKEVTITFEQYSKICEIPNCHYCNKFLDRQPHRLRSNNRTGKYMLDRIDNNIGYTFENVVPCCWDCNRGKGSNFSYETWKDIGRLMGKYFGYIKE